MALNREQKRQLKKQGQLTADGTPARRERTAAAPTPRPKEKRTGPATFVKEVRAELRKVAWPTRNEVVNYSIIVFITVVIMTLFVGALDWLFGSFVLFLFD